MPLLDIRHLTIEFKTSEGWVKAVDRVSLTLTEGEIRGLVGESGSGKSLIAKAICGVTKDNWRVTADRMRFDDIDLLRLSNRERRKLIGHNVSMIFQEPQSCLDPSERIGQQLIQSIPGWTYKGRWWQRLGWRKRRAIELLHRVGIKDHKDAMRSFPYQLTEGECQKVMIAIALANQPRLLIADEPTTALDVTIQAQILQLIAVLQKEMAMGVIFITHDMGVVADIADRVLVMYRGEAVETGSVEEIFRSPQHPYTQSLLAAVPRLGEMRGQDLPRRFPLPGQPLAESETPDTVVAGEPILQVRDLVARFPVRGGLLNRVTREVHAVEKVSFDLWPGETLSLVGESGCGKSTTGRALLRLVETQGGTITFDGQRIDTLAGGKLQALRRNIQFIFQDPYASLDPRQTVGDSIMEPLRVHGLLRGEAARERVAWLLKRVGLQPEHAWRYPHAFSGGQRQRICIARALALNPKVVIADESVSALDVSIRAQIINLMLDLQREMGIAFLFISHDMAVVERISHRVAVMYRGRIVEIGPRRAVFENPQHPYTRKLMAAVPVADPGHRHPQRVLLSDDVPGNIYKRGEEIASVPLQQVGPGHFVARESADVLGRT